MSSTHDPDNVLPVAHPGTSEAVRAVGYLMYHHLDTDRPVEPQRGQRRSAALRVWEQEDRSPPR